MADRIIYECTGEPLTPKLDKLRKERVRLANWAKRLGGQERAEGDKPVVRGERQKPPVLVRVSARNFLKYLVREENLTRFVDSGVPSSTYTSRHKRRRVHIPAGRGRASAN